MPGYSKQAPSPLLTNIESTLHMSICEEFKHFQISLNY